MKFNSELFVVFSFKDSLLTMFTYFIIDKIKYYKICIYIATTTG